MPVRSLLTPGTPTPIRPVPPHIPRPEYVGKPSPARSTEPYVQTAETVELMRHAGKVAAQALAAGGATVAPGVTTDEVDRVVHEFLLDHDAYPSTLGYKGFPKSCCTSLNEVICHGIPDSTVMQAGDILNVDVTAYVHGVHGDCNATFTVGEVHPRAQDLVDTAHAAMMRGVKVARPGREVNVIGRVIEKFAARHGMESVHDYTGHGVAEGFHNGLVIPHYDSAPMFDDVIEENMTFTIEPMLTLGSQAWEQWDDGWTVVTRDRSFSAQFEHTMLITADGPELLTVV